jgi:two-component system, LuxR family, sensor kinase FixL
MSFDPIVSPPPPGQDEIDQNLGSPRRPEICRWYKTSELASGPSLGTLPTVTLCGSPHQNGSDRLAPTRVIHPQDDGRGEHFRVRIEGFGVGTWDLDLKTLELEWSETARILFGIESGQSVSYALFLSRLEPNDRERIESAIRHVSERGGSFDVSFRVAGALGRAQWIRARAGLIRDDAGAARHLSGIFLDVDEEKQVEETLRTRESHLRSILQTIPDAMIVIDGHGVIQLFSAAAERLFGWVESEAIGQNVRILMPEPDSSRHDGYIAR